MHHVMVGIFRDLLEEGARARSFKQVVEDNALLSGPFSEERAGFSTIADTVAVPDGNGGWLVSGKKNWADRKSVVSGTGVSVRVYLGGRRVITKETTKQKTTHNVTEKR